MDDLQAVFSSSQLFWNRATGFAYEPSWLAHQLNMLYLPLWLAASVRRSSVHRLKLWGITFENALLAGGFVVLWLTVSRVGLVAFLLTLAYLLLKANLRLVNWLQARFNRRKSAETGDPQPRRQAWLRLQIIVLLVVVYLALFAGTALVMRQVDRRMESMFDFKTIAEKGFLQYANQLLFAERIVYWQVGWDVFNDHPWLGVGLGNAGYFLPEKLSSFGWGLGDLNLILYRDSGIPNTKSLWSRLLADTGLVGFGLFLTFILVIFLTGRSVEQRPSRLGQTLGLAAQLAVVALLLEGFSLDTFALPYYWVTFGLVTAAWNSR
jgi:O-antigen ligase